MVVRRTRGARSNLRSFGEARLSRWKRRASSVSTNGARRDDVGAVFRGVLCRQSGTSTKPDQLELLSGGRVREVGREHREAKMHRSPRPGCGEREQRDLRDGRSEAASTTRAAETHEAQGIRSWREDLAPRRRCVSVEHQVSGEHSPTRCAVGDEGQ